MTPNEYQSRAMSSSNKDLSLDEALKCATIKLNGEAGEIAEIVGKHFYHGHPLVHGELIKELGDVIWYVAYMADALGVDLETIMTVNLDKVEKRYPYGFSYERSINREE